MENFESLEIGDSIMSDWAQIISDALDILKFDGAVQDTLAELRRKWSGQIPALLEERFDTLGIQYMKLPHEMGVAALGQELSTFGWALYDLDEEDEYLFVLIPAEERNKWERYCKKAGAILPPDETARAKMGRPCQGAGPWEADALRGIHTPR
ncbi:MAG: hypothetical protein ACLTAZ_13085 [Dysosmobacter welbionis]|uniref:hypothetical protein n=1 Tax=Dysosmobacter welbionis TaxID=2093857 RepID=UPI00399583A6